MRKLALIPAIWLAVSGAASPPPSLLQQLAECRLSGKAAAAALPALETEDMTEVDSGPQHRIMRTLTIPDGLTAYGLRVSTMSWMEVRETGNDRISIGTSFDAPYPQVKAAVLTAHRVPACQPPESGSKPGCPVFDRGPDADGWSMALVVQETPNTVFAGCGYFPRPQ